MTTKEKTGMKGAELKNASVAGYDNKGVFIKFFTLQTAVAAQAESNQILSICQQKNKNLPSRSIEAHKTKFVRIDHFIVFFDWICYYYKQPINAATGFGSTSIQTQCSAIWQSFFIYHIKKIISCYAFRLQVMP